MLRHSVLFALLSFALLSHYFRTDVASHCWHSHIWHSHSCLIRTVDPFALVSFALLSFALLSYKPSFFAVFRHFGILFCITAFVTAMQEQHMATYDITFAKQKQKLTNEQIINVKADDRGEYHKKKENRTLPESSFVRVCVLRICTLGACTLVNV